MRSGNKQWLHPPDALTKGNILYTVKFYGECEVDAPKGTEVVKDAIRKRKFNKTIRKTEGQKTPKVEISISIDSVTIQEPKSKIIRHQYPLHRISYCADDKSDRRMFTFIAKAADSNTHYCYVFASDKNAEEITLTIGQAFDLAYRRFLETQGKDADLRNKTITLQKRVETLERENAQLKARIRELEAMKDRSDINNFKQTYKPGSPKLSAVGKKLENLMFEPSTSEQNQNGAPQSPRTSGIISPPPPSMRSRAGKLSSPATPTTPPPIPQRNDVNSDLASVFASSPASQENFTNNNVSNPFSSPAGSGATDPFGMPSFTPTQKGQQGSQISEADRDFLDLQAGFSRGLSFGSGDFGMDDFDPLNRSTN